VVKGRVFRCFEWDVTWFFLLLLARFCFCWWGLVCGLRVVLTLTSHFFDSRFGFVLLVRSCVFSISTYYFMGGDRRADLGVVLRGA